MRYLGMSRQPGDDLHLLLEVFRYSFNVFFHCIAVQDCQEAIRMTGEIYQLKASHAEHGLHDVTLAVCEVGDDFQISCQLPLTNVVLIGFADDCFAALQGLRRKAEERQWNICCRGARRNVWPSEMSRQTGGGVQAYTMEMGRPATMDSLVDIFDADAPEMYASVADQEAFAEKWFQSLRRS